MTLKACASAQFSSGPQTKPSNHLFSLAPEEFQFTAKILVNVLGGPQEAWWQAALLLCDVAQVLELQATDESRVDRSAPSLKVPMTWRQSQA